MPVADFTGMTQVTNSLTAIYQAGGVTDYNQPITTTPLTSQIVKGLQFTIDLQALRDLGLQVNDVLISINGEPVFDKGLTEILELLKRNTPIILEVLRLNDFIALSCGSPCTLIANP
ncbi:MAG: hypothetical protein EXR74_00425 [Bdellovibrionales bacterium]|nr:hypothetical protein [Bdellovibrionales bacterium]